MIYILYTIHVLICLFLIMVVLLQQGSGADLSVFGGGGTQTAFGARSATNLLHKLTVAGFVGFILTTIAIGFVKSGGGSSVMTEVEQSAPADEGDEAVPAVVEEEPAAPASEGAEATPLEDGGEVAPASEPESSEESGGP